MDPVISAALITAIANIGMNIFGGIGQSEEDDLNREAQLKMAADRLGLDWAQLKQQADQYKSSLDQKVKEHADSMGLNWAQVQEEIRSHKAGEKQAAGELALGTQKAKTEQAFGVSDRLRAAGQDIKQDKMKAGIRSAFSGQSPKPVGAPTMAVKPTASVGAAALANNQPAPMGQDTTIQNKGRFPLNMGA